MATLQETVSEILKRPVTVNEAMKFANDQFGTLATYFKEKYAVKLTEENASREYHCSVLSHFICDDEELYETVDEALTLLQKQAEIDGSVMADDVVMMWEKVSMSFTVNELLTEIGL